MTTNLYTKSVFSKLFRCILMYLLITTSASAQTFYTMSSGNYTQDFSTMGATWTSNFAAPAAAVNFSAITTGTYPNPTATTVFSTTTGGGVQKGTDASNGALQTIVLLVTGSTDNNAAAAFDLNLNFTGRTAGTISLDWAEIANGTGNRVSTFKIQTNTGTAGAFVDLPSASVPVTNNVATSGSFSSVTLPSGFNGLATAKIRFYIVNGTGGAIGSRPKISIDNINVTSTAAVSAPTTQVANITFANPTTASVDVSWTNGNGNGRIVKINTTNTFTSPTTGTAYTGAANYILLGEQVVYSGTGNTVTVTGLTPGQIYYLRAYEYTATGLAYNITTATNNPNSTTLNFPAPVLSSISPTSATAGGSSFVITATGTNFYSTSIINWNGSPRTTTYVNATTLTASISAGDISSSGSASVTVTNPTPGGGTSAASTFTINPSVSPLIGVNSSFTAFTTNVGTPSASQSYTVTGSNLTANILITAPASFEISTDNTNWFSTITLTQVSGSVALTTMYVRLNTAVVGVYSGTVDHTSTGATTVSPSVSGKALSASPSLQSSLTISSPSTNSLNLSFTGGDGASRIVVASLSPITYVPIDGVTASGVNANFSLATNQGGGNVIVYDGSGNSVNVIGLAVATTYYFAVYEYNGTAPTLNYLQASPGLANASTLATEPTISSTVSYTRMSNDTAYISFTGGNGTSRVVVIKDGAAVSFIPADGNIYTGVNTDLTLAADQGSANKIVYIGNATSVKVTGFSLGAVLNVAVYEYNGSGITTNYRTTTGTATATGPAYIPYSTGTYSQAFDGLPLTGTPSTSGFGAGPYYVSAPPINATSLTGWQYSNSLSGDLKFASDNGTSTSGSSYSYGTAASTDRSLGCLASSTVVSSIGAILTNSGSTPLTTVTITYDGENWRSGGSGNVNQLLFQYQVGSSSIKTGTFTSVAALNFNTPNPITGSGAALNGNDPLNKATVTGTFTLDSNWASGQTLAIRWLDVNESGNDDGLGIDNFIFSAAGATTPLVQDNSISFNNILTTSMDVNWVNGDGANHLVIINTSNSFTNPSDGIGYSANPAYSGSGQQVISAGSGSSVNVSGLTVNTPYFFRVYGYNGTGTAAKYNTATATNNPKSQVTANGQNPTKLVVTNLNNGNPILENTPFSITIQSQDAVNSPQNVLATTLVTISLFSGTTGSLAGTLSGSIASGSNTITITGIIYTIPDFGVVLKADATSGDVLAAGFTNAFDVLGVATQLSFTSVPAGSSINTTLSSFQVQALRADLTVDIYYSGSATIAVATGPGGSISGTLIQPFVNGIATFTGIQFSIPSNYTLSANSGSLTTGTSSTIIITSPPILVELVVPQYMGSKTTASANNARTPVAFCIRIDNLLPNTTYNFAGGLALTSEASTVMGAGGIWNGSNFGSQIINNAFVTDVNGSSGPYWVYFQPSGNSSRFDAGMIHNIRIAFSASTFGTITPNFVGTKTIKSLDIASTERTLGVTTDDGAFLLGSLNTCLTGKNILVYDNAAGTGNPLYAYQAVNVLGTQLPMSELPDGLDSVYGNTATPGSFAAIIPIGLNNANGIQRVEARDALNNIFNVATDADGIWPSGANTTNVIRRSVTRLTNTDASLSSMTAISVVGNNATCFGSANGSATASATSSSATINYLWSPSGHTNALESGLGLGNYTVTATDANGCSLSTSVAIAQAASNNPTASNNGPKCFGDPVTLTASTGSSFVWSGPNGYTSTSQTAIVNTTSLSDAGVYTVIITYASGCTESASTSVALNDCSCTPPTLTFTKTNVACFGGSTGAIDLTITNGVAPYIITWSNGQTTEDISGLAAGSYKVVVREQGGCKDSVTITITQPASALSSTVTGVNTTCNGSANGSVNLTVSGGTSPYTYLWSNLAITEDLSGVVAGTYSVTIQDLNLCTSINSITVTQPAAITITLNSITNPLCNGALTGAIDISTSADAVTVVNDPGLLISEFMADPTGTDASNEWVELIATRSINFATTPFSVVFVSNGIANANGWKAGAAITYGFDINIGSVQRGDVVYVGGSLMTPTGVKLRVKTTATVGGDAFGNANGSGILGQGGTADAIGVFSTSAASITATTVPIDAIFYGTSIGTALVSGGTAGYELPVNDKYIGGFLQTNSYFIPSNPTTGKSTLATGTYNYQTGAYSTVRTWTVDPTSYTDLTSSISLVNSVSYLWSNNATTQDISAVGAGTYTVTVTNGSGCTANFSSAITQPSALAISQLSNTPASCSNTNDGALAVSVTGGTAAYAYLWNNGAITSSISGLLQGNYTVTVTDANNCTAQASYTVGFTQTAILYYADGDDDTYGSNVDPGTLHCVQPLHTSLNHTDCNDASFGVNPGAQEICNTIDDDCDGLIDDADPSVTGRILYYTDADNDTYGSSNSSGALFCFQPAQTSTNNTDCNDGAFAVNPGAQEICNGIDDDCDGLIDDADPSITGGTLYYTDADNDTYGSSTSSGTLYCVQPLHTSLNNTDCNDAVFAINPGVTEVCGNGIDDNCNGLIDEGCSSNVTLNLTMFIQGFYISGGTMTPALENAGISSDPLLQEVDSVVVELHDAITPFGLVETDTKVLKVDGTIQLIFSSAILNGSYYIVVKHRNAIETWSKNPVTFSAITTFDLAH